jgi:CBS domain-containing protein
MSKSKEAIEREQNKPAKQQHAESTFNQQTDQFNQRIGAQGQTDYTPGRESARDFPRRSTSLRYRNEDYRQSANLPSPSNRQVLDNRRRYEQANAYENRNLRNEDTGDFYSRSINEGRQRNLQGSRQNYEQRGRQGYGYQENFRQRNQADLRQNSNAYEYGNYPEPSQRIYRNEERENRSAYNQPRYDYRSSPEDYNYNRGNQFDRENDYNRTRQYSREYDAPRAGFGLENVYDNPNYATRDIYNQSNEGWDYREPDGYRYLLRCRDIMTRDVTTCAPESNLREVADKMEDDNVGSIPVIENGRLIGLVTDRDIICRVIAEGKDTRTTTAREAMTADLVTCTPDESIIEAIHKMGEHQIRRIPICDPGGRLQGFISIGDIALEAERDRDLARVLEQISRPTPYQSHRR